MSGSRLPVVMYHSVDRPDPGWIWDELVCPLSLFARQVEQFVLAGYRSATLDEVRDEQASGFMSVERRVVLSFDDGYLDNWVHVYPILKRAGWRGVVYVNPEFIDPGERPRLNLEDVWAGRCSESDLQTRGFLNWAELEILDRSGVLEVGSHSMSHTWFPTGPEIVDFHRPGLATPWLAWNARPDRKPFYLGEDQSEYVPWGTPVFRNGRSLGVRRFLPDEDVETAVVARVASRGGILYFSTDGWRDDLRATAREADRGRGRFESDRDMLDRFKFEIIEASRLIAARLGREVRHFCWPGGAYCDDSWELASRAGFRTMTVKRSDPLRWKEADPSFIRRISDHRYFSLRGRQYRSRDAGLLIAACDDELGRAGSRTRMRLRKLFDAAGLMRSAG